MEKLIDAKPDVVDSLNRHRAFVSEIERLQENREIEADTAEDTISYDRNIEALMRSANDAANVINWAARQEGLTEVQIKYYMV